MSFIPQQARVPLVYVEINGTKFPGFITQPWYQYVSVDVPSTINNNISIDQSSIIAGAFLTEQSAGDEWAIMPGPKGDKGEDGSSVYRMALSDDDRGEAPPLFPSAAATLPILDYGKYTPTLTNVANVAASTAYPCKWMRIGNVVTVSGRVDVDPTAAASTQLGISLPVASNFGAAEDAAGTAFCPAVAGQGAAILADAANNRLQMQWVAVDVTNQSMYFTATYEVI